MTNRLKGNQVSKLSILKAIYACKCLFEVSDSCETWSTLLIQGPLIREQGVWRGQLLVFEKLGRGKKINGFAPPLFCQNLKRNWIFSMKTKEYCPLYHAVEILFVCLTVFKTCLTPHTHILIPAKSCSPFQSILKPATPTVHSSSTTLLLFSLWFDRWDNTVLT